MNTFERFEGELPALLEELASPQTPDYLEDVFGLTVGAGQRPAWTFPHRWFHAPARAAGVSTGRGSLFRILAIAILALLAVVLVGIVVVGAMRTRVPTAFGVAVDGRIAYTSGDDIVLLDPLTGESRAITTGAEIESAPAFSPDGTRLAYKRLGADRSIDSYDLVVAQADGSDPRIVATLPVAYWSGWDTLQWTPDGRSLLANVQASGELRLYDASGAAEPRVLATGVTGVDFRPPRGDRILFRRLDMSGTGLYTMSVEGSDIRPLMVIPLGQTRGQEDLGSARWSPDGSMIAFTRTPPGQSDAQHIYVMNADGSDIQPLPMGEGTVYANNLVWSPDGSRLAFERWGPDGIQPIGVLTLETGKVISAGPELGGNGVIFDWSPDGRAILAVPADDPRLIAIDPTDGSWAPMGSGSIDPGSWGDLRPSWQRIAMP